MNEIESLSARVRAEIEWLEREIALLRELESGRRGYWVRQEDAILRDLAILRDACDAFHREKLLR